MRRKAFLLAIIAPLLLLFSVWRFYPLIAAFGERLPKCAFRSLTGLLCPGCGNTHAVLCLLRGDVLGSLRNNPFPLSALLLLLLGYAELLLRLCGKPVRLFPRRARFWWITAGLFLLYYILRNFI